MLDILKETGYTEDRFFIHCDGALFGMMVRSSWWFGLFWVTVVVVVKCG